MENIRHTEGSSIKIYQAYDRFTLIRQNDVRDQHSELRKQIQINLQTRYEAQHNF